MYNHGVMTPHPRGLALLLFLASCGDATSASTTTSGDATSDATTSPSSGGSEQSSGAADTSESGPHGSSGSGGGTSATGSTGGESTSTSQGSDPGTTTDSEVAMECAEGVAKSDEVDAYLCECKVMEGLFPDLKSCLASMPADIDPGCRCSVYAQHPEDAAVVTCLSDALTNFAACLPSSMCTEKGIDTCLQAYFAELGGCPDFSLATQADIEVTCKMVPAFHCGSGEVIPETWVCDNVPDCADEGDELDCFFKCEISGEIFPKSYVCDGTEDCADGTDEKMC